jgi:hypothetical protein
MQIDIQYRHMHERMMAFELHQIFQFFQQHSIHTAILILYFMAFFHSFIHHPPIWICTVLYGFFHSFIQSSNHSDFVFHNFTSFIHTVILSFWFCISRLYLIHSYNHPPILILYFMNLLHSFIQSSTHSDFVFYDFISFIHTSSSHSGFVFNGFLSFMDTSSSHSDCVFHDFISFLHT